jgi:hypothetical protein
MDSKMIIENLCDARSTTKKAIAGVLGVDESTIYRKIAKNLLTMEEIGILGAHFVISVQEMLTSKSKCIPNEEVIAMFEVHVNKFKEMSLLLRDKND